MIETLRLRLRPWREQDRDAFIALHNNPDVMADLGGVFSRQKSNQKFDRYLGAYKTYGYGRWVIETKAGQFLGYSGIMHVSVDHPLGEHDEIGWRLSRRAWGQGYASEASQAALQDGFTRLGFSEIIAYTAADNPRSQAVMERIGMKRDERRDFTAEYDGMYWSGLVWALKQDIS